MGLMGRTGWALMGYPSNWHGWRYVYRIGAALSDADLAVEEHVRLCEQLRGAVAERDYWRKRAVDLGARADELDFSAELQRAVNEARGRQ